MALKTSIVTLLITLSVFTLPIISIEYPQQLIEETYFQDLYNMKIHFPVALPPKPSSQSSDMNSPLVPAFFILGDSSVDCGNNNFLGTFARADRLPYGRDFDTHQPTGRFCNGRIPVDFLALRLGLPFVPSYLGQVRNIWDMIHGVNYASAGAGIIFSSGSDLGQRVSLSQQIQQASDTFEQFMMSMGEDAAVRLISDSVFYISVGTNDYIHYYLQNVSGVQSLYSPWSFNHFLSSSLKQEIKKLHTANVRKVVVMGVAPMGCAPHYLWLHKSKNGECIKDINNMIMEFNFVMRYMIRQLNQELSDSKFIFCDMYEGSMDIIENHERYGLQVTTEACCGLGKYKGWIMCLSPEMACSNASTHIWWDQFHPTEAVNAILADNVWSGLHSSMCYPMHMKDMLSLDNCYSENKALEPLNACNEERIFLIDHGDRIDNSTGGSLFLWFILVHDIHCAPRCTIHGLKNQYSKEVKQPQLPLSLAQETRYAVKYSD